MTESSSQPKNGMGTAFFSYIFNERMIFSFLYRRSVFDTRSEDSNYEK